jgi:essential nuclear protein 1
MSKRIRSSSSATKTNRAPLSKQILDDTFVNPEKRSKKKQKQADKKSADFVPARLSQKILDTAKKQLDDIEQEDDIDEPQQPQTQQIQQKIQKPHKNQKKEDDSSEDEGEEAYTAPEFELDEDEEKTLAQFMSSEKPERVSLAAKIFEKIREKGQEMTTDTIEQKFDPRIVHSYRAIGKLLSTYSTGKVPKAFKIIPTLERWEEILLFTNPDEWSPHATYQATKLFASNMNPKMAQRFYNMILLPAVRNDIHENKKLNYHLFHSLKKAIYKPSAFFKGILLPIAESKTCSLKEAVILGSVISRITIPVLHAAAALLKLAEMEYSGTNSYFIRVLVEKKFTLPYRVVDALAIHFSKFMKEERTLPVLWHQSLLAFVETYKTDLTVEQNAALKQLIKIHTHHLITDSIRRELSLAQCRGDGPDVPQPMHLE